MIYIVKSLDPQKFTKRVTKQVLRKRKMILNRVKLNEINDDSSTDDDHEVSVEFDHVNNITTNLHEVESSMVEHHREVSNELSHTENNTSVHEVECSLADDLPQSHLSPFQENILRQVNDDEIHEEYKNQVNTCIKSNLAMWAVTCRVPHATLGKLLEVLKRCSNINVPKDPRTLLKTPIKNHIIEVSCGKYQHYGIERGIKNVLAGLNTPLTLPSVLKIGINIDDVPINRINSMTVITCSMNNSSKVFLIGAFLADKKEIKRLKRLNMKLDQDEFLVYIVDELIDLFYKGFDYEQVHYVVMLDYLCADAPANAKAITFKGHTGYYSCTKCEVQGFRKEKRICFTDMKTKRRTDEQEYSRSKCAWKKIPNYRLVTDTVLDYMHLILLGNTKRLLLFWTEGGKRQALGTNAIRGIDKELKIIHKHTPTDFVRDFESLDFVSQWKATQFRQFLLYEGIYVLKKHVPEKVYEMFLHLTLATRICCSTNKDLYSKANKFMKVYIKLFIELYGKTYCNHNVHGLCHVYVDVLNHGPYRQIQRI